MNASLPQRWPKRSSWKDALGRDLSQDRRGGHPSRAPCLHQEGLSPTTALWGAGDPQSESRLDCPPHRSGGQRHHQSGCSSLPRLHPPPPPSQGWREQGGRGRERGMGPQQQGPVFPQPLGMPGWFQPPGQADPVQRLALMMALMVLGMPSVHGCYAPHQMWSVIKCGHVRAEDLPTD